MNYLTHAIRFLDQPFFVAGTAIPDWLRLLERKRASSKTTRRFLENAGHELTPMQHAICQGILQHHVDDDRFHNNPAFLALNGQLAGELRQCLTTEELQGDELTSMRVHFIAHIAIELLLDSCLVERFPDQVRSYYRIVDQMNGELIATTLAKIIQKPVPKMGLLIRRFGAERFIYDYVDDTRLWRRINQVLKRVTLPPLPRQSVEWLRTSRLIVEQQSAMLLEWPDMP